MASPQPFKGCPSSSHTTVAFSEILKEGIIVRDFAAASPEREPKAKPSIKPYNFKNALTRFKSRQNEDAIIEDDGDDEADQSRASTRGPAKGPIWKRPAKFAARRGQGAADAYKRKKHGGEKFSDTSEN